MISSGEYVSLVHSDSPWFGGDSSKDISNEPNVDDNMMRYLYLILVLIVVYLLVQYLGLL